MDQDPSLTILSFDWKIDGMKLKENLSEDLVYIFNVIQCNHEESVKKLGTK